MGAGPSCLGRPKSHKRMWVWFCSTSLLLWCRLFSDDAAVLEEAGSVSCVFAWLAVSFEIANFIALDLNAARRLFTVTPQSDSS